MVLLRRVIGDALRARRQGQHRTLREVSTAANVSLGYLSEIERGQKEASSELLAAGPSDEDLAAVLPAEPLAEPPAEAVELVLRWLAAHLAWPSSPEQAAAQAALLAAALERVGAVDPGGSGDAGDVGRHS